MTFAAPTTTRSRRRAFTLIELLVTVALISVLATLTLVGVSAISRDARLSSAQNTVTAVLGNARALAMKTNSYVLVAFRARAINDQSQVVEAVTAQFSGSTYYVNGSNIFVDRFVPIEDVPAVELNESIKIGGPLYAFASDLEWVTSSELRRARAGTEAGGGIIGVMYAPDGTTRTDNPRTDAVALFVDFNSDGDQRLVGTDYFPDDSEIGNYSGCDFGDHPNVGFEDTYYCQVNDDDEPYIFLVPFITVLDDAEIRDQFEPNTWSDGQVRVDNYSEYINERVDRIHFNRYTGVPMR